MSDTNVNGSDVLGIEEPKDDVVIQREDVDDSPFVIISDDDGTTWFGVLGPYKITEKDTKENTLISLNSITWNRITQVVLLLLEQSGNLKNVRKDED
jgi:hypothetical protein